MPHKAERVPREAGDHPKEKPPSYSRHRTKRDRELTNNL
jgi:hypothetical protein